MKSVKCQRCLLVQWPAESCKRCGESFGADHIPHPVAEAQDSGYSYPPYAQPELKSGMALTSMILAIIAFPTMVVLIGILLAPVAFVLGIIALVRANRRPTVYGGKAFAIAGITVSSVVCFFFVPMIAAIAIPNLLAAKRAANEGSALGTVRMIAGAQAAYSELDEEGDCGDTMLLAQKNLIDGSLRGGVRNGYRFTASGNMSDENGCEVTATPVSNSEGTRSFYYSSVDGVFRVEADGGVADYSSLPVGSEAD